MKNDEKVCPRCAETIKAAALVCRYCKHEFDAAAKPKALSLADQVDLAEGTPVKKKHPILVGCGSILALVIVLAIIGSHGGPSIPTSNTAPEVSSASSSPEPQNAPSAPSTPPLEVVSWHCGSDVPEFIETTGQVKNVSDKSLSDVEVVAQYSTRDGTFVKSDSALIAYNPILPGQTSPFKTISTSNPLIRRCNISFKTLMGGTIEATTPNAH